ncbi:MAG TPA: hypothetical protein VMW09_01750 [Desulfatiglandales bacterium]|nr:hypothetical protein [Desulfatiglandales bacterium]
MNKGIETSGYRTSETVIARTGKGKYDFRRMWGGIAWPEFPKPGAVCVVGEFMPNKENVGLGQLVLLDKGEEKTIDGLLRETINLKDHYCAKRFYVDERNEGWMETFKRADGLTRYEKEHDDKKFFPYFKGEWLLAFITEAPQADNPEFGLQIVSDWLNDKKLLVEKGVKEALEAEGVFPVTQDRLKEDIPPVIKALGFVLAAYFKKPFSGHEGQITNWDNHIKKDKDYGEYREVTV